MSSVDGKPETVLEKFGSYGCGLLCGLIILAIAATSIYAATSLFLIFLPLWGAILFGIPVGVGALALCFVGGSTLMEAVPKCFIMLILAIILIPVFQRAKQNAQTSRIRNAPAQIQAR